MKKISSVIVFLFIVLNIHAQTIYQLDASKISTEIKSGYFKMGNAGPAGKELLVNSRYLTIGGVPQIPVMGELQYSRMPKERWEDEILKMKACGVNIIATYCFWIHHEEIEGQFDFSGNKDLKSFAKLCQQLGVLLYPRIGPWSHGECRNGGTPDWILRKKYLEDRSLDPVYKTYVDKYFQQVGLQLKGLMYKNNGPVVGIQLENEYWKGKAGEPYMMWLKQTALKYGMDVPLYTVTGWGDGSVPANEMIPLWGGYPDESWAPNADKIVGCGNYQFQSFRDDPTIGNAQVTKKDKYDYSLDPYFTCEMGVGIFNSIQRRPIIGKLDGLGMIVNKIGSGGNLLGYYIFAGASNPVGIYSTMEENKDETGYWAELSPISYDFQAAIKENGMLAPSYYEVKKLDYFLNEFGSELAPMEPAFTTLKENDLQYAVRAKDNRGFLFGINYCRNNNKTEKKQVQFQIKLKDKNILFPSKPINIPDSSLFIWPLNLDLNGSQLVYATAQPLCKLKQSNTPVWIFVQDVNILPELCFNEDGIEKINASNGEIAKTNNKYIISNLHPSVNCVVTIFRKKGEQQKLIILSKEEGKFAWVLKNNDQKNFFISKSGLYLKGKELSITDTLPSMQLKIFTGNETANIGIEKKPIEKNENFVTYNFNQSPVKPICNYQQKPALENAEWLVTSVKYIDGSNKLYHKEFQKEFSVDNPAKIKSAKLIIALESSCRFRINDKWCAQKVEPNKLNVLDVTGYINKGDNVLLMDFPYELGNKVFAANLQIEYFNSDRVAFATDGSWSMADEFYFPATYGNKPVFPMGFIAPVIGMPNNNFGKQTITDEATFSVAVPCNYLDGVSNLYLAVKYRGDRISTYLNNKLIADNLNNNTEWMMDLKRNADQMECRDLMLEIKPWKDLDKIYFDNPPPKTDEGKIEIENIRFVPEYNIKINLQ